MPEETVKVKEDSVLSRLAQAAESLVSLEVATVVADKPLLVEEKDGRMRARPRQISGTSGADGAFTRIDLLQGDMLNVVASGYVPEQDATSPVLEFHEKQVGTAKDIVAKNIDTVINLASAVSRRVFDLLNETKGR